LKTDIHTSIPTQRSAPAHPSGKEVKLMGMIRTLYPKLKMSSGNAAFCISVV
jgi:hypothetical protein